MVALRPINYVKIEILHASPKCGKAGQYLLGKLIGHDNIPCIVCGDAIDLNTEDCRSRIAEAVKKFGKIKGMTR